MSEENQSAAVLETWLDAAAPVLGLEILPQDRASVLFNLAVTLRHAALVESVVLDDEAEPAPIFVA